MQVGDKWHRVEIVDEKEVEEFIPWEGGGGGLHMNELRWVLHCDCGKDFEVAKNGFRKKLHNDCGCGLALQDGRKVLAGPYTVPQSTLDAINRYARENTNGNASHALTLIVRQVVESTSSTWPESEVNNAKR